MKTRWLALLVENEYGILARISGMFAGKAYNLESLTVGVTDDLSVSRMTLSFDSDDMTFEQIKKQLNRSVGVIKTIDFTNTNVIIKELMYVKITPNSRHNKEEVFNIVNIFNAKIIDYSLNSLVIESTNNEKIHLELIALFKRLGKIEIVRGGAVAIDSCKKNDE